MSVVDNKGSFLNQSKETIKDLLKQLQQGDHAVLILVSDNGKKDIKTTSNLLDFLKQVDAIEISYSSGFLHNSILQAANILSGSKNFNKEIYLLSDFQQGRLAKDESLSDLSELLNDKIKLYTFNYSGKDVFNLGLSNLKINTQIFEKDKPVSFLVEVSNYSERSADDIVISLFINGERSAQQSVSLSGGETKLLIMESTVKSSGFIDVYAEIEDDEILQDNRRYTNLFIPDAVPIIIFTDNLSDARFVELALLVREPALPSSRSGKAININLKSTNQVPSFVPQSGIETVIIIGSENLNSIDRLAAFVNNGGGLFLMPGENSSLQNFQKVLQALSLPIPSKIVGEKGKTDNTVSFSQVEYSHPIFQDIFVKDEKKKIESPDIYSYFKMTTEGKGRNIISLIDGSSFLSEYKIGKGKIFLMNTAPVLSWSNFPLKGVFVPLINKSVFYLASKDRAEIEFIAGNEININIGSQSLPQVKIERPDKAEEFIKLKQEIISNIISYDNSNVAGNYKIYSGEKLIETVSVNIDPLESVTKYLSKNEFENYLDKINFKGIYIEVNKDENPMEIVLQSRFGSELWKYFLIIAIVLALIEMAVARNSKKDLVTTEVH